MMDAELGHWMIEIQEGKLQVHTKITTALIVMARGICGRTAPTHRSATAARNRVIDPRFVQRREA
jgi:hypothetical protein